MEKYILIGAGSPSDLEELNKPQKGLSDLTVFEYLKVKGIGHLDRPLNVSCHRTLDRAIGYAKDLQAFVDEGNALVAVFCGGLSLALPGIVSSQTTTVPIIGVPFYSKGTHGAGIDAATAVWNLPPGTVVGGTPVHFPDESPSIDRAVLLAENVLNSAESIVHVIGPVESKQVMAIRKLINPPEGRPYDAVPGLFGIPYEYRKETYKDDRFEVALSVCGFSSELVTIDRKSRLALQSRMPYSV
ncbi:AIR carboxylase family protein, partial [Candidatus Woesearchaeota archaeon]|nr:AIR carboxylase family protein [Candidatus Woesearchaeota archaeon]